MARLLFLVCWLSKRRINHFSLNGWDEYLSELEE